MTTTLPTTAPPPAPARVPLPAVVAEVTNGPVGGPDSGPVLVHGAHLVRDVVDRLLVAGVTPPAATLRALALDDEIAAALTQPTPAVDLLADRDLTVVDGAEVADWITAEARASSVQTGRIAAAVAGQLLDRAAAALFEGFDALVAALRPQFDPAARVLSKATTAGVHPGMSAEDVVDDDTLVTHWRSIGPAVEVLDRTEDLWHRLALVAGVPLGTDERARRGRAVWLAAAADGPPRLLQLADRAPAEVDPDVQVGRLGHRRSGTATVVQREIVDASEARSIEQEDRRRAARHAIGTGPADTTGAEIAAEGFATTGGSR